MPICERKIVASMIIALAAALPAHGQTAFAPPDPQYLELEKAQNEANSKSGSRSVPSKVLEVPTSISTRLQEVVAAPYGLPRWTANHPQSAAQWKAIVDSQADATLKSQPDIRRKLGVGMEATKVGGVPVFILTPERLPPENRDRILLHIHGGGFAYNPGEAGTLEATLMAAFAGYKVVSVDYRLIPDHPYPAALDDVTAVYRAMIGEHDPRNVAVFGTSAGGNLVLALMLRAKAEGLALPAAIAPSTPWSDITKAGGGDTMKSLEWVDSSLVSYDGYISHAAQAYANGRDPRDPFVSPLHGDFAGMPPAILTSGTRDLFLSLTVLTHRKMRQAGVDAQLQVFEGMAHAQYFDPWAPESKEVFQEIGAFFHRHLAR